MKIVSVVQFTFLTFPGPFSLLEIYTACLNDQAGCDIHVLGQRHGCGFRH